ncbi:MAG TPA: hypothetical protein VM532_16775 [Burkholderiales bacterium]|nr:hypothetical protein [Burkholderiales bacterium]
MTGKGKSKHITKTTPQREPFKINNFNRLLSYGAREAALENNDILILGDALKNEFPPQRYTKK